MRILVAHPSPSVAEGLSALLTEEFTATVTTAITLADCRLVVADFHPDLAVVDVALAPGHEVALCDLLIDDGVKPVILTHPDTACHLTLLEHGAAAIVVATDGLAGVFTGIEAVLAGHAHVPPHLLGSVLHDLIVARRASEPAPAERLGSLSPREREVLAWLGQGADTRAIAERLVISPHTAKTHINRVLGKLGLSSRTEAATFAVTHGVRPSLQEVLSD